MPQFNFDTLMSVADRALNYFTEGKRLVGELTENYADAKDVLSATQIEQLEAKFAELRQKSAEVHEAIQQQD